MSQYISAATFTFNPESDRTCGTCHACCTWLGVTELSKFTGEKCTHLRSGAYPTKRCSIYARRPTACSNYLCLWRAGWGPEGLRPSDCGILITPYPSERNPEACSMTACVFDPAKAKPILNQLFTEILTIPRVDELRVVYPHNKRAILFRDGLIYRCRLLPPQPGDFESLTFEAINVPIGSYATSTKGGEVA